MNKDFLNHEIAFREDQSIDINKRSNKKILILGVGALGSWIAEFLSRQGYSNLTLLDMDRVENKNLGSQNFSKKDTGRMKASCIKNKILLNFESLKIDTIEKKLAADNANKIIRDFELVIDVFDNIESRAIVKKTCKELKIDCLHTGMSDDGFSEIEWNEFYQIPKSLESMKDVCDYPLASNLVFITVGLVCEVVNAFVDNNKKRTVHFTLNDLHIDNIRM
jgi:hypothetical protein